MAERSGIVGWIEDEVHNHSLEGYREALQHDSYCVEDNSGQCLAAEIPVVEDVFVPTFIDDGGDEVLSESFTNDEIDEANYASIMAGGNKQSTSQGRSNGSRLIPQSHVMPQHAVGKTLPRAVSLPRWSTNNA